MIKIFTSLAKFIYHQIIYSFIFYYNSLYRVFNKNLYICKSLMINKNFLLLNRLGNKKSLIKLIPK